MKVRYQHAAERSNPSLEGTRSGRRRRGRRVWGLVAILAAVTWLSGCQGSGGGLNFLSEDQENAMGVQAYQQAIGQSRLSANREWAAMVERCGRRIAAVSGRPDFAWEFKLLADQTVNAFCLPGGKVAFYEGIMPVCQDENGVAVVMGHEIAHALRRHGGQRVSQNLIKEAGVEIVAAILAGSDPGMQQQAAGLLGAGANVAVTLPFSRGHESEADRDGLTLMAKAGYDPRAAPPFWERMAALGGNRSPEFLSTHPSPTTRVAQLKAWMPEALQHYRPNNP